MFKRIFLPLIAITPIYASEEANPGVDWCKTAEIANQTAATETEPTEVVPAVKSIMIIISHLQRGILIMEQDTNKECEEFMRNIAAEARALLIKLMALAEMGKLAEYEAGLRAELIRELYQTYVRFNDKLEATYNQAAAPADTAVDAAPAIEESPTT
jgi:hypothetical protein